MKEIVFILMLTFVPVFSPAPLPCGGTRCVCKVPLQPHFVKHDDGSVTSKCIFIWRPQ